MREIIFDTETTGLDPLNGDRVVEIGCVEVFNLIPTGQTFHVYINPERDMPEPAFGIQMIYTDHHEMDFIAPVFEHDAVVITEGYHPNTGIPGFGINFVWMMAGLRPHADREWADMHWQEEFAGLYR